MLDIKTQTKEVQELLDVRGKEYDSSEGERSVLKVVNAFNSITGKDLTEAEGWLFLELLKNVRQWSSEEFHKDSQLDGVAYALLKGESLSK